MFYFVNVFVLCSVNERHYDNREWYDTVEYRFGVNAETESEANDLASRASEHALGRDGDYIGGIVKKKCASPATDSEINDLLDYCFSPIENPGIFYVTGVTHSSVGYDEYPDDLSRHLELAQVIQRNGLPNPTFRHPEVDTKYYPRVCRLVCANCQQWVEFDRGAFIFAFFSGIEVMDDEFDRLKSARKIHDEFAESHASCSFDGDSALQYLEDSDERFSALDRERCLAIDPRIAG